MQKVVITSRGTGLLGYLRDLRQYQRLLWALTYRNLRAQYAQTLVGFLWILINPLVTLLILGFVFGRIAKMDTQGIDPFLFTVVGLSAWTYFSRVVSGAGRSVLSAQEMIKKIYFPRLLLPFSVAIAALLDLLVVLLLVILLLIGQRFAPSGHIIYLPLFLLLTVLLGVSGGIWASAMSVRYRDFHHVIPFLLQVGLYASPVAYSVAAVDPSYRIFFLVNPLTGVLEGFRWCFFGGPFPQLEVLISLSATILLLVGGMLYFLRVEKTMADII